MKSEGIVRSSRIPAAIELMLRYKYLACPASFTSSVDTNTFERRLIKILRTSRTKESSVWRIIGRAYAVSVSILLMLVILSLMGWTIWYSSRGQRAPSTRGTTTTFIMDLQILLMCRISEKLDSTVSMLFSPVVTSRSGITSVGTGTSGWTMMEIVPQLLRVVPGSLPKVSSPSGAGRRYYKYLYLATLYEGYLV